MIKHRTLTVVVASSILTGLLASRALWAESPASRPSVAKPPAGAVVLFDGTEASLTANWTMRSGKPAAWPVADGAMSSAKQDIITKERYGDFTLHVEFCEPVMAENVKGQERGNSGVYLQGRYELQVLDSYGLTSKKNDCGAIYNVKAPKVNACLPPGQWQTYDVTFTAAKYDGTKKSADARVTVYQNGTLIQDDTAIPHPTGSEYLKDGPAPGPVMLQFHSNAVQYRNVWIVPGQAK